MSEPCVRFYCLALPSDGPQLGFDYLEALDHTDFGVRACPIGPAYLMAGDWPRLLHLFTGPPLGGRDTEGNLVEFVNVVCAPPGLSLGFAMTARQVAGPRDAAAAPDDVVYQPKTALAGLYTIGVKNIAITMPRPALPDEAECAALALYDFVLCPTSEDAEMLGTLGVPALHVPPDPQLLDKILRALIDPEG